MSQIFLIILIIVSTNATMNIIVRTANHSDVSLVDDLLSVNRASQITIESDPSLEPTQQLRIQVQSFQIGVQYCKKFTNPQHLTQVEFNDPHVQSFLEINISQAWKDVIGDALLNKLNTIASLQIIGSWRCKEYFVFEYDPDIGLLQSEYTLKARGQFKSQMDVKELLRDSQEWTLIFQINQDKSQHSSINMQGQFSDVKYKIDQPDANLIIEESESQPSYTIKREVQGEGLHQNLLTEIQFQNILIKGCSIVVLDHLDIYSYVDKDELDKLNANYQLQTVVDIERPSSNSQQHIFLSQHILQQDSDRLSYSHQYHFRYQLPSEQDYEKGYVPRYPSVFVDCLRSSFQSSISHSHSFLVNYNYNSKSMLPDSQVCNIEQPNNKKNFSQLIFSAQNNQSSPLYVNIPVGYAPYKQVISMITIGITLGMSIYLGKVMAKQTKNIY